MEKLVNVLQDLIEKYNIMDEDVATIQEALSALESGGEDEFTYAEEEVPEEA